MSDLRLLPDTDEVDDARAAYAALLDRMGDALGKMLFNIAKKYGTEPEAERALCELHAGFVMARVCSGCWSREEWLAAAEKANEYWYSPIGQQQIAAAAASLSEAGAH